VVSAVWFVALLVFFVIFKSRSSLWTFAVLWFGALGWVGFFLGPSVYRWISSSSPNVAIRSAARIFGVAMIAGWLLMLYGSLVFWMPYVREMFVP